MVTPDYEVRADGRVVHNHFDAAGRVVQESFVFDEWDELLIARGYIHCRPHDEWHQPPECAIRLDGTPAPWWEARDE